MFCAVLTYSVSDSVRATGSGEDLKRGSSPWNSVTTANCSWEISCQVAATFSGCLATVMGMLSVLYSAIGVVARGTDLRSKGFTDGSRVYYYRGLSRPGMEIVKTICNIACIEGLLVPLQDTEIESGSVS